MNNRKITVSLNEYDVEWIKSMAVADNLSAIDIIRRAIRTERFIRQLELDGKKLIIEYPNGSMTQLVRL